MKSHLPSFEDSALTRELWLECRTLELETLLAQAYCAARIIQPEKYEAMREAAHRCGYALAVHGSLARDVDLLAMPWVPFALSPRLLATAVAEAVGGFIKGADDFPRLWLPNKPHGRISVAILVAGTCLDLAIAPRTALSFF